MSGTSGNDFLILGDGYGQTLDGLAGNDTLVAGGGNNQQSYGGDGADSLLGGTGLVQTLRGDAGNDTQVAGVGNDQQLFGGADADSLQGGNGLSQFLYGETGNDRLVAGGGDNQRLWGDNDNDSLLGSTNHEALYGGNGNDTLDGGGGEDTLVGGEGDDALTGGDGNDFASYADATAAVDVRLSGGGNGYASGGAGTDGLVGIEGLIGSIHDDTLAGDDGAITILSGDGVDSLSGGTGNDLLDFGTGDENYLRDPSDSGNDTLIGGNGTDTLDLGSDWAFLSLGGAHSLYRDQTDTIYAQGWEQVVCFAEGSRIVTPNGEDAVENLRAGDMVLAMRGGQAEFEPLRWVGFMDIAVPRNAAMAAKTAPILIKAGAIAPGMPARDLRVSPDHAMEVDGHLIPAKHLVNGSSIIQETWCRRVRYFHLELEAHGLLLSEGTWSESYLDDGNRHAFNNAAITGLFLDFEAGRSKGQYDAQACLPVLRQGLKLDEIHGRLALRAEDLARGAKGRRRG